jgi:DNA-binding NtrC family response regulator
MKIFIVDDESEIVKLYMMFLRNKGHEIIATSNSTSAFEIIEENSFDLIITDKRMPKVSGNKIIEFVEDKKPMVPILVLTADSDMTYDFSNPQSKIVIKPIMMADLIDHVEKIEKSSLATNFLNDTTVLNPNMLN